MKFYIWEGHLDDLKKKVATIERKCAKYGCDFLFRETGEEEVRDVPSGEHDPVTGKVIYVPCRYVEVEAEGTAVVSNWELVSAVEHTEKGNIYSKVLTDVEIPERYRDLPPICEHCNSDRKRKYLFIVRNTETGDFKQVGKSCLRDFTYGLSASFAAYLASLKAVFEEYEERPASFGSYGYRVIPTDELLRYAAETIRHYGYARSSDPNSTRGRVMRYWDIEHGLARFYLPEELSMIRNEMRRVGFDADSPEAAAMVEKALGWLHAQEDVNDYLHNLLTVTSLEYGGYQHLGLLVSLFPTADRELEREAKLLAEKEAGKNSDFVGEVGKRVDVSVESVRCLTSWESSYGYNQTVYIWGITDANGNRYTWKTSNWIDLDYPPKAIRGTVKEHKVYRDVKQTELTRCKVTER